MNDTVLSNDTVSMFFSGKTSFTPADQDQAQSPRALSARAFETLQREEEERQNKKREDDKRLETEMSPAEEIEEERAAHAETVRAETQLGILLLQGVNPLAAQGQAAVMAPSQNQRANGKTPSAPRGLKPTLYVTHKSRSVKSQKDEKHDSLSAYFNIQATATDLIAVAFDGLSSTFSSAVNRCKKSALYGFSHKCFTKFRAICPS